MSQGQAPRLGRGLASLIGGPHAPAPTATRQLPVDALSPGPFQPRGAMDASSLEGLAASIRSSGVLQPLLVRPDPTRGDRYQIIAGERRWRAAQLAGLHEVPVFIRPLRDEEAMAAALVENLQRVDLNAIEEAEGFRKLIDEFAMTHEALASAVGKSRSHVSNMLRLLNLPAGVQAEVRNGALSAGHARALLAHPDPSRAALQVIAGDLSVRRTEALAADRPDVERREADPDTADLVARLTERLGLQAGIERSGKGGTLKLKFRDLDQLDGLIGLLLHD